MPALQKSFRIPPPPCSMPSNHWLLHDLYERELESAKSYTTFVTGIGYAGVIAIWSNAAPSLDRHSALATGAMLGLSLLIFVTYESAKVVMGNNADLRFQQTVAESFWSDEFEHRLRATKADAYRAAIRVSRLQPLAFWTAGGLGFAAAMWLFGAMAVHLA